MLNDAIVCRVKLIAKIQRARQQGGSIQLRCIALLLEETSRRFHKDHNLIG
jgi:hypothetical protein